MSRISDRFANSIVYLYASRSDGQKGTPTGGSGFLFGIPTDETSSRAQVFVVTCRHLLDDGFEVIRLNSRRNGVRFVETRSRDWIHHAAEDLAIFPLPFNQDYEFEYVRQGLDTINGDMEKRLNFGSGDELYVVGRFIPHDGREHNAPVVRMGNLARSLDVPIENRRIGLETQSYLVDMRGRGGVSGSPVIVKYSGRQERSGSQSSFPWSGERLLGIAWGSLDAGTMIAVTPAARIEDLIERWHRQAS